MLIQPIEHKHFPGLFDVTAICEPWWGFDRNTSDRLFSQREGFVLLNDNEDVCGHITLSDYAVKLNVVIHCAVLPDYQKRWLTRKIYTTVFDHIFDELGCVRATGFSIDGLNGRGFHERLGFTHESTFRKGFRLRENYYDLHYYGMLKNERRW